jgi:hypothetical protein
MLYHQASVCHSIDNTLIPGERTGLCLLCGYVDVLIVYIQSKTFFSFLLLPTLTILQKPDFISTAQLTDRCFTSLVASKGTGVVDVHDVETTTHVWSTSCTALSIGKHAAQTGNWSDATHTQQHLEAFTTPAIWQRSCAFDDLHQCADG